MRGFKRRNNLQSYRKYGEAGSVNSDLLPQQRSELKSILAGYNACDIFNCDETELYWKLEPRKTLAHGPVSGKKLAKDRVSLLVTCNAVGDEKLPLLFIHSVKNPRAMRGIDKKSLGVWYYHNKSGMQRSIFVIN